MTAEYPVVSVDNLSLCYKLYDRPEHRLREALSPFRRTYHRKFFALDNISLQVNKGDILGIVGRNGAGKSTLLKAIAGVLTPTSGSVAVRGDLSAILELQAGFNPDLTGMENIYFYGSVLGFRKEFLDEVLDDILAFADIGEFIGQPLKTYSTGMRARLAFAVSTHINPEVLIIDEVLAVGDVAFKRKCFAWFEQFIAKGNTIIFVSHSDQSIIELCNRAILLDRGKLMMEGAPKDVVQRYLADLYEVEPQKEAAPVPQPASAHGAAKGVSTSSPPPAAVKTAAPKGNSRSGALFLPDLQPSTSKVLAKHKVSLSDVTLTTPAGRSVNSLVSGENYLLSYNLRFEKDARKLHFNMVFKTLKGQVVSGAKHPPGKGSFVNHVEAGELLQLKWEFACGLLAGTYSVDLHVVSFDLDEKSILLAAYDILLFKVQKSPEMGQWGIASLGQEASLLRKDTRVPP